MKHLIIGNGIAGINAARAIREMDTTAGILMVSDETFPPYSRPMISYVLEGSEPHEKLPLFAGNVYEDLDITPVLGNRVAHLDVKKKFVHLENGTDIDFQKLLIASGADARHIRVPGADLGNIFTMRTQKDVLDHLAAISQGVETALVLGGGLVGFKAAHALLKRGIKVTMLITSAYPLAMQVDPTAGRMILKELQAHGLSVKVGVSVSSFDGDTRVKKACLDSGETLDCDLVIVGKGVDPSLGFIAENDIAIDYGILVDPYLCSSVPDIYAAGDAAESMDIARQKRWINAIWPEAAIQGKIAGYNMAGRKVACPGSLGRNVMRIFGLDIMTVGLANPDGADDLEILQAGGEKAGVYRSLIFCKDILVGAVLVNQIEQGGILRAMIENRIPVRIPKAYLMSLHFDYSKLL
ncbi:MAG: FAD-dependent oxidoreductase [Desulfotignum sp.]|jgi:NAD(P)H-nitrite reductase large subunit|nr:FAD-dependent oxidoreductase [Desulfotignum sp.]